MDSGQYFPETSKPKLWTRNYLFTLLANQFVFLSFHMLLPTLPLYVQHLNATEDIVGLVMGVSTLTALGIRPYAGQAVDTKGRKSIFLIGMSIIICAIFSYSLLLTIPFILTLRLIHGLGWGFSTTAVSTIVIDFVPKSRLAEGMGYYGLANVISMALSPAFGLFIVHAWGFYTLFYISTLLAALGAVFGSLIKYPQICIYERKHTEPKPAFFEKTAYLPAMMILLVSITYAAISTFISLFAATFKIQNIGLFFTFYAISSLLTRPVLGKISDKKGFGYTIIPGIILSIIALIILYFAQNIVHFLIAAICYGIGFGALLPTLQALAVSKVSAERRGAATSTFLSGIDIGSAFGMIVCGYIAKAAGYSSMYLFVVIPLVLALLLYLFFWEKTGPSHIL